eukprot:8857092-Pyramimonas_sp.AAC.1
MFSSHLHVLSGMRHERASDTLVDGDVLSHDFLALHSRSPREASNQTSKLHPLASNLGIGRVHHACAPRHTGGQRKSSAIEVEN